MRLACALIHPPHPDGPAREVPAPPSARGVRTGEAVATPLDERRHERLRAIVDLEAVEVARDDPTDPLAEGADGDGTPPFAVAGDGDPPMGTWYRMRLSTSSTPRTLRKRSFQNCWSSPFSLPRRNVQRSTNAFAARRRLSSVVVIVE